MVKLKEVIGQCVTLSTTDCVSDSEEIRRLSVAYHPQLLCLENIIHIKFNSVASATEFIKKLKS